MSAQLCACNRCVHAVAAALALALALYRPLLLALAPVIACSYGYRRRGLRLARDSSVCGLRWQPDGSWIWWRRDGAQLRGHLVDATVLGPYCVWLHLRAQHSRRITCVPLAHDSLTPDAHRHLRARLTLWQPPARRLDAWLRQRTGRFKSFVLRR